MLLRDIGAEHTQEHLHSHSHCHTSPDSDFFENGLRIRHFGVIQIAPEVLSSARLRLRQAASLRWSRFPHLRRIRVSSPRLLTYVCLSCSGTTDKAILATLHEQVVYPGVVVRLPSSLLAMHNNSLTGGMSRQDQISDVFMQTPRVDP